MTIETSSQIKLNIDKLNILYLQLQKYKSLQGVDSQWQAPTLKVKLPFDHVINVWPLNLANLR